MQASPITEKCLLITFTKTDTREWVAKHFYDANMIVTGGDDQCSLSYTSPYTGERLEVAGYGKDVVVWKVMRAVMIEDKAQGRAEVASAELTVAERGRELEVCEARLVHHVEGDADPAEHLERLVDLAKYCLGHAKDDLESIVLKGES